MDAGRIDLERARREAKRRVEGSASARGGAQARRRAARGRARARRGELAAARAPGGGGGGRARGPRAPARAGGDRRPPRPRRGAARARPEPRPRRARRGARARRGGAGCARRSRATQGAASRPAGAREWLPLLYVAHSAFLGGERTDGLLACARALLDAGADPDSSWQHPEFGALGALCGAAGVAHEPRMTALLLEAGANPDDDESVYHATETSDHTCLRLLLDAGARVEGTDALAHALDTEDPAKVRLLLEHDAGQRGRALAAVCDLPRALARGHPPARRARRRPARLGQGQRAHAATGWPGAWAGRTSASCSPSWARAARSGRSTS